MQKCRREPKEMPFLLRFRAPAFGMNLGEGQSPTGTPSFSTRQIPRGFLTHATLQELRFLQFRAGDFLMLF